MLKLTLPLCLAALVATAHAADNSPLTHLVFQRSLQTCVRDANGKLITGTEVGSLAPHQGRLYAANCLWKETDPTVPKGCQILVLDSPKGQWRVDHQFAVGEQRCSVLQELTFATDARGKAIAPVSLLLAVPDVNRGQPAQVYCRDDATGEWSASTLGTVTEASMTRSLGLHRDKVTGIDRVFAGNRPLGAISGVYDPAAPGRIRWDKTAEFVAPTAPGRIRADNAELAPRGERVMGFCDCNGILYAATSRHIYQRTDGATPAWKDVYFCEKEITPVGIRGLTAVPKPGGKGEDLWFVAVRKVRRLDPAAGFKETIELDLPAFLTEKLGLQVTYVLAAYNDLIPYNVPGSGEKYWMFGFECTYADAVIKSHPEFKTRAQHKEGGQGYFAGNGRYCIRHARGASISYEVADITDPAEPKLVATRTIAVSPYPEDQSKALYFGGYDGNGTPAHNTAWIYRGELTQTLAGGNARSKKAEAATPAAARTKAPAKQPETAPMIKLPVIEGGLFRRVTIPGFSEIHESIKGFALADLNRDGLTDIIAIYKPRYERGQPEAQNRLRVFLNRGNLRFEPHAIHITGSDLTADEFATSAEVPNLVDFNNDGFLDLLVTRTAGREGQHSGGNTLLVSQGKWDEFRDVSAQMGIANADGYNRQSSIGDVNGDGWLDIAVACDTIGSAGRFGYPLQRLFVFKPKGPRFEDGHFEDIGGTALVPDFGGPYSHDPHKRRSAPDIMLRDLDGDGALDLIQTYHLDCTGVGPENPEGVHEQKFGVWCWRNMLKQTGQFRFEKMTNNGLATEGQMHYNRDTKRLEVVQHSVSLPYIFAADFENRGLLDLLGLGVISTSWHGQSDPIAGRFWRNLGGFQFQDITKESGLDALSWPKYKWHEFWGVTTPPGQLAKPTTELGQWTGLPAEPAAAATLYNGEIIIGDFDNDGLLDFVLCDRSEHDFLRGAAFNVLFLNRGGGRFEPMPLAFSGINSIGMTGEAADLNNDGLLDLVFGASPENSWGPDRKRPPEESFESKVYINTGLHGARENHWLHLRFSGVHDAELIGARVEAREPATHALLGTRIVFSNHGYKTCNALDSHFGLGKRDVVEVKVILLNGKTVTFPNVRANRFLNADLANEKLSEIIVGH